MLFLLSGVLAMAQSRPKGAKVKDLIIRNDTIQIDSLSINPGYLEVYDQSGVIIERALYQVDYTKAKLWFIHKEDDFRQRRYRSHTFRIRIL